MKDKPPSAAMLWTRKGERVESPDPEAIAIALLGRLAADPDRLGRFLALTGLAPATLRQSARNPDFLAAVLDHVAGDERLLMEVAAEAGIRPDAIAAAKAVFDRAATFDGATSSDGAASFDGAGSSGRTAPRDGKASLDRRSRSIGRLPVPKRT